MCIIIAQPNNVTLAQQLLLRCWLSNSHGGGIAYVDGGQVKIFKELYNFDKYYEGYLNIREQYPKSKLVLHMRIKTHGDISLDNCHPFVVNDRLAVAHNGTISAIKAEYNGKESDTAKFTREILQQLPTGFQNNPGCQRLIQEFIGHSKLAFLSSRNEITIINPHLGEKEGDVWYSNGGYKAYRYADKYAFDYNETTGKIIRTEKKKSEPTTNGVITAYKAPETRQSTPSTLAVTPKEEQKILPLTTASDTVSRASTTTAIQAPGTSSTIDYRERVTCFCGGSVLKCHTEEREGGHFCKGDCLDSASSLSAEIQSMVKIANMRESKGYNPDDYNIKTCCSKNCNEVLITQQEEDFGMCTDCIEEFNATWGGRNM